MLLRIFCLTLGLTLPHVLFAVPLDELVKKAYQSNPAILEARELARSKSKMATVAATPSSPMVGVSTLDRGAETQYLTISQNFKFPVKYYMESQFEKSKALSAEAKLLQIQWEIRERIINVYYSIYANQQRQKIVQDQIRRVKEVSRVAEKKYAAGTSPQSDQMRAHMELAQLELTYLQQKKEEVTLQNNLRALVHDPYFQSINLESLKLAAPKISDEYKKNIQNIKSLSASPFIADSAAEVTQAEWKKTSAAWEYAPDLELKLQERISGEPQDSRIVSVGVSIPLWFWGKNAQYESAKAELQGKQYKYHHMSHMLLAEIRNLFEGLELEEKTLSVYETSLIPQAQSAYNSSKNSYRASRISFLGLLEVEQILFKSKSDYYTHLIAYIKNLTQLESKLGKTISDIKLGVENE